jgi:hypothetical protein
MMKMLNLPGALFVAAVALAASMLSVGSAGARVTTLDAATAAGVNYEIVNVNSGYCLTILGDATANGSLVYQAQCKGAPGQIWIYVISEFSSSRWNLFNPHSGKCLDTSNNHGRAQMYIWSCDLPSGNLNQMFYILASGSYVTVRPVWNTGQCMGVAGGSLLTHMPVVHATCDNSYGQKWYRWPL